MRLNSQESMGFKRAQAMGKEFHSAKHIGAKDGGNKNWTEPVILEYDAQNDRRTYTEATSLLALQTLY